MSPATLLSAAGIWLAGLLVLGLAPTRRVRGPLETAATAAGLGLALVPALVVLLAFFRGGAPGVAAVRVLLGILSAGGLLLLVLRRRRDGLWTRDEVEAEGWRPLHVAGLFATLFFAGFAVFNAASMPVHVFDPLFHFAYKGKLLFHEGLGTAAWTDVDGAVGRVITHPDYPPGLPGLQVVVSAIAGHFDEDATRALLGLFVVVPAVWLFAALRGRGRGPALFGALSWVSLPILYYTQLPAERWTSAAYGLLVGTVRAAESYPAGGPWTLPDGWTLDGAADLPLAALFFGAFLHLWRASPASGLPGDRADTWIGGVLLGGVLLAKNEGAALALVLALALLAGNVATRTRVAPVAGRLLVAGAVAALLSAAWFRVRAEIPSIDEGYPALLRPATLADRVSNAGTVALGFLGAFANTLRWNLVWPLLLGALLWSLARPLALLRHPALAPILAVLGAMLVYFLVLLVTPWDLELLFGTVIPGRLLLHVTPLAILALVMLLWRTPEEAR